MPRSSATTGTRSWSMRHFVNTSWTPFVWKALPEFDSRWLRTAIPIIVVVSVGLLLAPDIVVEELRLNPDATRETRKTKSEFWGDLKTAWKRAREMHGTRLEPS